MKIKTEVFRVIKELLEQYTHLIDPQDSMQKNNLKFVEKYIGWQKRKNVDWENDCVAFLKDAIDLQTTLLNHIRKGSLLTN